MTHSVRTCFSYSGISHCYSTSSTPPSTIHTFVRGFNTILPEKFSKNKLRKLQPLPTSTLPIHPSWWMTSTIHFRRYLHQYTRSRDRSQDAFVLRGTTLQWGDMSGNMLTDQSPCRLKSFSAHSRVAGYASGGLTWSRERGIPGLLFAVLRPEDGCRQNAKTGRPPLN
jgi:hypothetical protein